MYSINVFYERATYWKKNLETYLQNLVYFITRFSSNSCSSRYVANNDGFVLGTSCITEHPYYFNSLFLTKIIILVGNVTVRQGNLHKSIRNRVDFKQHNYLSVSGLILKLGSDCTLQKKIIKDFAIGITVADRRKTKSFDGEKQCCKNNLNNIWRHFVLISSHVICVRSVYFYISDKM